MDDSARVVLIVACVLVWGACMVYALYVRRTRLPFLRAALEERDDPRSESANGEHG